EAFFDCIHPEDREFVAQAVTRAVEEGAGTREPGGDDIEHRIVGPDGAVRWMEGRGRVFRDQTGEAAHLIGIVIDITERKRAERRVDAQHGVTRVLAEAATLEEATPEILQAICQSMSW